MSAGPQRFGAHSALGLLEVGLLDPEPASIAGAVEPASIAGAGEPASIAGAVVVGIGSLGGVGAVVGGDELVGGLQAANASTNTRDILPGLTSGIVRQLDTSMPAMSDNFPERDAIENQ